MNRIRIALSACAAIALLTIAGGLGFGGLGHGVFDIGRSSTAPDLMTTGSIDEYTEFGDPTRAALESAFEALALGDFSRVRQLHGAVSENRLDHRLLTWAITHSGDPSVSAADIRAAMLELKDWPDLKSLERRHEVALARENPGPTAIVDAYGKSDPVTLTGAISLARAWLRLGNDAGARDALAPWWHKEAMRGGTEMRLLAEFGSVLTQEDHRKRFLAMMYRDRIRSAQRVADLAGMNALLGPWAAAIRRHKSALALLDKADDATKASPHHLFARITYLRRVGRDADAAKLLLESPVSEEELGDPDEWWVERRIVSRDAYERGDAETAYQIAAMHRGGSVETQVEAAFHAGWYALRGLDNGEKAAAHFARIEEISKGSISRARGAYWLGRAFEAEGSEEAKAHYIRAADYASTYYGMLARDRIGMAPANFQRPSVSREDRFAFSTLEPAAAMRRLEDIGQRDLARELALDLGRSLNDPPAVAQLVAHWESRNERYIALRIAKAADWRGVETGALTHPIGAIPASAAIEAGERPLAYAIARQESEFNVAARSGANARGLMQLLPGTAREVAQQAGIAYEPARLDTDGGYNATLGTAYLNTQLDRFDGSYILTFIAYNAGPGRARDWLKRFGDPRGKPLDEVIDWVETIPFTETRNYVQRVMENLQIYKSRHGQPADIARDLRFGRG